MSKNELITTARIRLTPDNTQKFLYRDVLIPVYSDGIERLKTLAEGELQATEIHEVNDSNRRSLIQNNLYWASCSLVAKNSEDENFNTRNKVDEQTKIACRHVDYYIHYTNQKTGEQTLNIKTGSIAFKNLKHLEACGFFTDAFSYHAELMNVPVDDWIIEVKASMGN